MSKDFCVYCEDEIAEDQDYVTEWYSGPLFFHAGCHTRWLNDDGEHVQCSNA